MILDEKNQIRFLNMSSIKDIDIKLIQKFINFDKFDQINYLLVFIGICLVEAVLLIDNCYFKIDNAFYF